MPASTVWFGKAFQGFTNGTTNAVWDWDTDTLKCSLHTSAYSPDVDAHDFWDDVTNEVSSANYTTGGFTISPGSTSYDGATNEIRLDAADAAWTSVTFTARWAVVYKSTGVASTSPLIALVDLGGDQTVSGGNFTITWPATGVIKAVA